MGIAPSVGSVDESGDFAGPMFPALPEASTELSLYLRNHGVVDPLAGISCQDLLNLSDAGDLCRTNVGWAGCSFYRSKQRKNVVTSRWMLSLDAFMLQPTWISILAG